MQTFLPFKDFYISTQCLDSQRLGSQINEATVLLKSLSGVYTGVQPWRNHPCFLMWQGYEYVLSQYLRVCLDEWNRRVKSNSFPGIKTERFMDEAITGTAFSAEPKWLGFEPFHRTHRAILFLKSRGTRHEKWYDRFGWEREPHFGITHPWPSKLYLAQLNNGKIVECVEHKFRITNHNHITENYACVYCGKVANDGDIVRMKEQQEKARFDYGAYVSASNSPFWGPSSTNTTTF